MSSWRYTKDQGWKEAESLLLSTDQNDWYEELRQCGFADKSTFKLGVSEKFAVEVYCRVKEASFIAYKSGITGENLDIPKAIDVKDKFFVAVDVGGPLNEVLIPTLPDLVNFLSQIEPICRELRQISETELGKEKHK